LDDFVEGFLSLDADPVSVAICVIAAFIAFLKKKYLDGKTVTLVGVLADGLTVSVIFPFVTLIIAAYSP